MNASEIHSMVSQWPEEALPKHEGFFSIERCGHVGWCVDNEYMGVAVSLAADLHALAGLKWLARNRLRVDLIAIEEDEHGPGSMTVTIRPGVGDGVYDHGFVAPTLIEAVHAAIMAVKGGAA